MEKLDSFFQSYQITQNRILRDLYLLLTSPKEFLYSYTSSTERTVRITPYNHEAGKLGRKMTAFLQNNYPGLIVHFIGSSALGVAGTKDLDILLECVSADFPIYIPLLTRVFGSPKKIKRNFIEWCINWKGYQVEIVMLDRHTSIYRLEMEAFTKLNRDKKLKRAYDELKLKADGSTIREYQRRKLIFYRRTLKIHQNPHISEIIFSLSQFHLALPKIPIFSFH